MEGRPLTVAELLRRHKGKKRLAGTEKHRKEHSKPAEPKEDEEDIDAKIRALEAELARVSDGSEAGCSSSDDESESDGRRSSGGRRGAIKNGVRKRKLVSLTLEKERIPPLPVHLLPAPGCGVPKELKGAKGKRRKTVTATPNGSVPRPSGLDAAVRDLLSSYQPRSAEHVPNYCRVCQFQGASFDELEGHRREPLHREAARRERRLSACKLCRKQFTSPPQLKEHLQGRAHRERLQHVLAKQGKLAALRTGGGGSRIAGGSGHNGRDRRSS
ncbi:unnamed protein product, partial [Phaeothamnion confervicola]